MEIGVGSGARARLWLDQFQVFDAEKGTSYYSRLKFLLGDYSPATLDTALAAVGPHAPLCSVIPIDATNPFKVLSFLRFKILFVHLTNVYDNLTFDEIARRDNQLYIVEVRPYVSTAAAEQIQAEFGFDRAQLPGGCYACCCPLPWPRWPLSPPEALLCSSILSVRPRCRCCGAGNSICSTPSLNVAFACSA